jgi:serine/threonine-protein kinase
MTGTTPPGTSLSMAPEARKSRRLSGASDQYVPGVILSDLLAGFTPPEADTPVALLVKKQTEAPAPLSERAPGLPGAAAEAVMRVLSRDPEDRSPPAFPSPRPPAGRVMAERAGLR